MREIYLMEHDHANEIDTASVRPAPDLISSTMRVGWRLVFTQTRCNSSCEEFGPSKACIPRTELSEFSCGGTPHSFLRQATGLRGRTAAPDTPRPS